MPVSGPSTFKARIAFSASLTIVTLAVSGCSLTAKKPELAAVEQAPRATSAAEAMQRAKPGKQPAQAKAGTTAFVDPAVTARPGQNVADFRASGRSAATAMRSDNTPSSSASQSATTASAPVPAEMTAPAMAALVGQPTGIQAGRNSIFSTNAAPAADIGAAGVEPGPASQVSNTPASLSTDAVAYAPVRRISGTTGGLFAGGPQVASNTDSGSASAPVAANHAPPGISTRPSLAASAQPVTQGLW